MNFRYLNTFVNVVEHRGFTEVSGAMGLTQSGVSRQIKALEEEVGVRLLERTPSAVHTTAAGDLVYRKAKQLLAEWEQLMASCQSLKHEHAGQLKIGASTIPAGYLLPQIIRTMREKHPRIDFSIHADDSEEVLTMLRKRRIDLAFVGQSIEDEELHGEYITADRLILIGSNDLPPLSSLEEVLRKAPVVIREKGSGTRSAVEEMLMNAGMSLDDLHIAAEVNSAEATLALVEAGVGYAFVSHWSLRDTGRPNLRILFEVPTERGFYLYAHQSRLSHPLIRLFTEEALSLFPS